MRKFIIVNVPLERAECRLEQLYRDHRQRRFQTIDKRHDGMTIAKEKQYLMVLGSPGVGKSTFLRKLGLEALKGRQGQLQSEQIPVFIELKTLRSHPIDLTVVITKEFETCGFPDAKTFTALSLSQGRLLLLLDGLDEVPTCNLNHVIEQIEAFAIQHDKNTFVASCRTAAYRSSFKQFTDVTIADFDDEQIEDFIQRWFSSKLDQEVDTANQYWQMLQQDNNKAAKELAQTPLLLTFLCLIYEREQTLPNRRSTLYGRALNILLSEWSAQKRLEPAPIYKDFHPELEKELLSDIAYNSFEEDRLFFSKSDITERITSYLGDTLDAPKYLDGQAVLQAIEVQQGILVERATDTYSFSHLTLQEYLTGLYISKKSLTQTLVKQHLPDERWREVFLLAIGLMGREGIVLLKAIDQHARTYISEQPKIRHLVQWADQIAQGSPSDHKRFIKTASAIAIAIDRASATDKALDSDIASDIASAIDSCSAIVAGKTSARASASFINSASARVSARTSARTIVFESAIESAIDSAIDSAIKITRAIGFDSTKAIDKALDKAMGFDSTSFIERSIERSRSIESAIDSAIESAKAIDSTNYLNKPKIFNAKAFKELPDQLLLLKRNMPQPSASANEWSSYANKLEAAWSKALGLTVEALLLSKEEWTCFSNYLYANELLLSCQRSSIGISIKAWEALEERFLTI